MTAEEVSDKEPFFPGKKPKRPKKKEEKIKPIKKKLPKTKKILLFRKIPNQQTRMTFLSRSDFPGIRADRN